MGWGMVEGKSNEVQEGKLLGVLEMFLRNNRALDQGGGHELRRSFNWLQSDWYKYSASDGLHGSESVR
jgi:hypothetical protein